MITREMLASKEIEAIETVEEAKEVINCLEYDECLEILKRIKPLPAVLFEAFAERAKAAKGGKVSIELFAALAQNAIAK